MHHWMRFQALTPVQHVAIIWRSLPLHLCIPLDSCLHVRPEFCALWCCKHMFTLLYLMPIFLDYPLSTFVGMSRFCPTCELDPQNRVAFVKSFLCYTGLVVRCPSPDDGIKFLDQLLLRG